MRMLIKIFLIILGASMFIFGIVCLFLIKGRAQSIFVSSMGGFMAYIGFEL